MKVIKITAVIFFKLFSFQKSLKIVKISHDSQKRKILAELFSSKDVEVYLVEKTLVTAYELSMDKILE